MLSVYSKGSVGPVAHVCEHNEGGSAIGVIIIIISSSSSSDRLCGLVVRASGDRYTRLGLDPRRYQIFRVVVGLERGPLNLVRSTEELLE
jgi:hypothetical protein